MPTDAPALPPQPPPTAEAGKVRGSLASRIALVTTAVALITALIVAAVAVPQLRAAGRVQAQQNLERIADTVASSAEGGDPMRGPGRGPLVPRTGGITLQLVVPGDPVPAYLSADNLTELESTGRLTAVVDNSSVIVVGRVLSDGSLLLLTEPVAYSGAAIAQDISRLLVALSAGVVIAALAGVVLARRLARPLKVAAAAAEEMAAGRRDVEIVPEGPVEVAEVAESLNGLNAALIASEARQREFLLSVSHELRTPMTSLRGYAEALSDDVVPAEKVPETAAIMVSESERLERIVTDLLDLARMGAREVRIDATDLDAASVVAETATVWADLCQREGVVLSTELRPGPLLVHTDPLRLRQMLDNLLTNALRMTPEGGPIVLAAGPRTDSDGVATGVWIQVRDGGPGLTDDDLAVAFEPAALYSRYRGVRPVGSGVGLALVGQLAQRLGGHVQAGHAPEGGAAFTLDLPAPTQGPPELG